MTVDRYITVHDAGRILHPGMADGQIRVAFAQGLGAALMEEFRYGADGSFQSGTFADYLVPTACEVPDPVIVHLHPPSPFTLLGAKGIGEDNNLSTPVCVANAFADSLRPFEDVADIRLPLPGAGDDVLWQARVSQLLEHLAELPADQRNAQVLQAQFDWLPPAGVLPLDLADFVNGRQTIFPPQFDVQAQPVPIDMVDALIAEASPLLPYNLSLRDQVQLLVPVPSRYYDPDLLKLDERVHPLFDLEISRL